MKGSNILVSLVAASLSVSARTFTVKNSCSYTVWPAIFTDPAAGSATPNQPTGWVAPAGSSVSFQVPDNWTSGRIWARTGCNFSSNSGSCATGNCNGGLLCTGAPAPPVSVAEFALSVGGRTDFPDVSLIEGFNVPITISNTAGCNVPACKVDLNPTCPSMLKVVDSTGKTVGCNSACSANLDGNPANSPNCCTGNFNLPSTCPSSGVAFYSFFKNACPTAYAYTYDESGATPILTCSSSLHADYTVTFCG
ncbi:thaumatin-like protein [Favolaschia claudopus]|uniref:Thaumatin-like protein n=1 Tax=Favolaschia claudopus TaxID=2862362 RepID=A0AAW0AXI4_9AGAR